MGWWWAWGAAIALAQPAAPTPAVPPPARGPMVQEAKPDVYYLKDKNGVLQPVLNFTLEDFNRLLNIEAGTQAGQPRPLYRFDKFAATGTVREGRAELKVTLTITVETADWIRVPLRLGGTVVRQPVVHRGPGEFRLQFDENEGEYVVWFGSSATEPHELTFDVWAPLQSTGGEQRLRLPAPRAWSSELRLTVPGDKIVVGVSAGSALDALQSKGGSTEIRALGIGSDFALTWRPEHEAQTASPLVLESSGTIQVQLSGRGAQTQARLVVQSLGAEFDSFRVKLPKGSVLIPSPSEDYMVEMVSGTGKKPAEPLVEVRLPEAETGPITIQLRTEQAAEIMGAANFLELGGFEVVGAVRQGGLVAVSIDSEWQPIWGPRRLVRQVEVLPGDLQRDSVAVGFEYYSQPFSLPARVIPRESRTTVDPQLIATVNTDRIDLETRLKYRIGGAKRFELEADFGDWEIDEVQPANLVDVDRLILSQRKPLVIPLRQAQRGDIELIVRGHRPIPAEAAKIQFTLPAAKADVVHSPWFVLVPDDPIDLLPREAETKGLTRHVGTIPFVVPARHQPPLVYRASGATVEFAGDFQIQPRTIQIEVTTGLEWSSGTAQVETMLDYQVARRAVETLTLLVPRALLAEESFELLLDELPLTWSADDAQGGSDAPVRVTMLLPEPRIGKFQIEVRYPLELPALQSGGNASWIVPLVVPGEGDIERVQFNATVPEGMQCVLADGLWRPRNSTPLLVRQLSVVSSLPRPEIALRIQPDVESTPALVVDRAWVQTWLQGSERQDRALYRLVGRPPRVVVRLPAGVTDVECRVDGQLATLRVGEGGTDLEIRLPAQPDATHAVVDLRWRSGANISSSPLHTRRLDFPQFVPSAWVQQTFWELHLPGRERPWSLDEVWSEEHSWRWRGIAWQRRPRWSQETLAAWCGAAGTDLPANSAAGYLYSSTRPSESIRLVTISRSAIVLGGAGLALVLGGALFMLRGSRYPLAAWWLAVGAASVAVFYSEQFLVLGQAAVLGFILALVGAWFQRRSQPRTLRATPSDNSGSRIDRLSTQTHQPLRAPAVMISSSATAAFNAQTVDPGVKA